MTRRRGIIWSPDSTAGGKIALSNATADRSGFGFIGLIGAPSIKLSAGNIEVLGGTDTRICPIELIGRLCVSQLQSVDAVYVSVGPSHAGTGSTENGEGVCMHPQRRGVVAAPATLKSYIPAAVSRARMAPSNRWIQLE